MPRYEFKEGSSNKFWQIALDGSSLTTTFGRLGSAGQSSTKSFPNELKAKQAYESLIAEKVKKGYQPVDGEVPAAPPPEAEPGPAAELAPAEAGLVEPVAPAPMPAPTGPTFAWAPNAAKEARKHFDALQIEPRAAGDAAAAYQEVHRHFLQHMKEPLEHGLPRMKRYRERQSELLWKWGSAKVPPALKVDDEAVALQLIPIKASAYGGVSAESDIAARLCDFWVAHSGLAFAIEAFAANLAAPGFHRYWDPVAYWLDDVDRSLEQLLCCRADRTLHGHLSAASAEAHSQARSRALELRAGGDLLVRSALSAVFLDPQWIEADLRERLQTQRRALITPEMLLAAPSAATLAEFLRAVSEDELDFLGPRSAYDKQTPLLVWALLEAKREHAILPLAGLLERTAELIEPPEFAHRTPAMMRDILGALACASNFPQVAAAACTAISACEGRNINKAEDPRPLAHEWLKRNPAVSTPAVREAAKHKGGAWARDAVAQLERLAQRGQKQVEEAAPDELPEPLRAPSKFKAPGFWIVDGFARPLTRSGKALPRAAIDSLGALLAKRDPASLAHLKEELEPDSAATFAWELFQAWLTAGAPAKDKWAFLALGALGNDDSARRLTPLIRAWPGEAAHQRAVVGLDVLAELGTDVALMMLNGIAQKLKFKGLQEKAREKMDEVAARRGLAPEELADRLVPDLDLEDDGSKVLDFGPRSFRVGFDETLSPFVMDASGARLKELPKPNAKDDPELSAGAVESWKAMKKDARAVASVQMLRMELAMGTERRWRPEDFHGFLISHPLLIHVVRRLVWGAWDEGGALAATFRVAEDRTLASIEDETFELDPAMRVGLVHPLHLDGGAIERWRGIFTDYGIIQPFEQLTRSAYRLELGQKLGQALNRFEGREVETKKVLGLLSRGWHRGPAYDAGCVPYFIKRIGRELTAALQLDPGLVIGSMEYTEPKQQLGEIDFGVDEPGWGGHRPNALTLSNVPEVILSEVIRDIESLGLIEEEGADQ